MVSLRSRSARRVLHTVLPALVLGPFVATAEDPAGAAGDTRRTALLVFVSYGEYTSTPLNPTIVRRTGSAVLAEILADASHDIVTYPEIEPVLREWRVRSERDIGFEFLEAVVSEHRVSQVVIARFAIHADRVLLLARGLFPASGDLAWVDVVEELLIGPDRGEEGDPLARLERAMRAAGIRLADRRAVAEPGGVAGNLVTLPLRPVGLGRGLSDVATHCLLRSLLAAGRWSVPDPTLVVFTLQREGFDPFELEEGSRRFLAFRFATESVLVPRLASFPTTVRTRSAAIDDGDGDGGFPPEIGREDPVFFSVVLIRCDSGVVVSGASEYLARENRIGIFGTGKDVRTARRFQMGADRLVRSLIPTEGSG